MRSNESGSPRYQNPHMIVMFITQININRTDAMSYSVGSYRNLKSGSPVRMVHSEVPEFRTSISE
jgi:hypothetical protein